jgi:hypothetical protein
MDREEWAPVIKEAKALRGPESQGISKKVTFLHIKNLYPLQCLYLCLIISLWKNRNLQHVLDNKGHCLNIVVIDGLSAYLSNDFLFCEFVIVDSNTFVNIPSESLYRLRYHGPPQR